jgi:hypothetical protein
MKLRVIGIQRYLQASSALIILGLLVEIVTLLWFHPLSLGVHQNWAMKSCGRLPLI